MTEELQELYDMSYNHIKEQGKPSINAVRQCKYNLNGLQCAAGPFITKYDPKMESNCFKYLVDHYPNNILELSKKHIDFVTELQRCHDRSVDSDNFMETYNEKMKDIAKNHGLIYKG